MTERFLIGTYTKKTSQGIYSVDLDPEKQRLTNVTPVIKAGNPTYLAISTKNRCYAVDKIDDRGGVAVFDLNQSPVTEINQVTGAGSPPAYIGIDEQRQLVFSGNYHLATIDVFKISKNGGLKLSDRVTHQGLTGPKKEQDAPHVHYCDLTPDHRLVVCDLGMDLVVVYNITDAGKLLATSRYQSTAGFGPRHITFHPNGKIAYLVGELGSAIEVLRYDQGTAQFSKIQTISTIPADWNSHNGAAAIHLSQDGRFVYASNRGQDALVVLAVQPDFTLQLIQTISTQGSFPRDFELNSDETFIICANQNTDNLTLFGRNPQTGLLTTLQKDVACPEGVCVKKW